MIQLLKRLFSFEKSLMVGTLKWTINWTDIGCEDTGIWLLYETESGQRSFEISNKACLTNTAEHPGYGDVLAWSKGGDWPSGAKRTQKGATNS